MGKDFDPADVKQRRQSVDGSQSPVQDVSVSEVVKCIRSVIDAASPIEMEHGDEEYLALVGDLLAIRNFTLALANGDTSQSLAVKGRMAGALKAMQAHLQHMTWQTQQVATGDFSQRMDFLGEFSEAFNSMTLQLEESRAKLRESEQRYRKLAIVDSLTGVYNRRHFFDVAAKELRRAERRRESAAILMIDADHFKKINDVHGHAAGDAVLSTLSRLITASIRDEDTLARYGGEEFILLCPSTPEKEALLVGERLRRNIAQASIPTGSGVLKATVSVGASVFVGAGSKAGLEDNLIDKIIAQADSALYEAKEGGRNQVHLFSS